MGTNAVNEKDIPWGPHPRYEGLLMKVLIPGAVNPALNVSRVRVDVGKGIPPHVHANSSETFYILQGTGICYMDGLAVPFGPGACFYAPAGYEHHLENTGEEPVEILAIFAPPVA